MLTRKATKKTTHPIPLIFIQEKNDCDNENDADEDLLYLLTTATEVFLLCSTSVVFNLMMIWSDFSPIRVFGDLILSLYWILLPTSPSLILILKTLMETVLL